MRLAVLCVLLALGLREYCVGYEVHEVWGCHDTDLRLKCRKISWHVAVLRATFSSNTSGLVGSQANCSSLYDEEVSLVDSFFWSNVTERNIRGPVNYRCSGVNFCSFNLSMDHPPSQTWGPGAIYIQYACLQETDVIKFCNEEVSAGDDAGEGFLQTPGYPKFYVGERDCSWTLRSPEGQRVRLAFLDVSLRAIGPLENRCTDKLLVAEGRRILYSRCGDERGSPVIESEGSEINVTLKSGSKTLYPKRGILIHYSVVGCPTPEPPQDGYMVFRNDSWAEYMCCVGFLFPDTLVRRRILHCDLERIWSDTLPDCVNITVLLESGNSTIIKLLAARNESGTALPITVDETDFVFDVLLPTVIIGVLLVGNAVILYVIIYLRKNCCMKWIRRH